jgi:hypothetical protein
MAEFCVHVPILANAVYLLFFSFFFRVKKGLQDSKVTRYIYLEGFLRGVMVLGLPEPDMIPLSLKG